MALDDVDPRFTLANERTFLAWIRTALALLAAAAGLAAIEPPWPIGAVKALTVLLAMAGCLSAYLAWRRWQQVERAIREGRRAPSPRSHVVLALVVALVAVSLVALTIA